MTMADKTPAGSQNSNAGQGPRERQRKPKLNENDLNLVCEWGECRDVSSHSMKTAFEHTSVHIYQYVFQVLGPEPPPLMSGGLCLTCQWRDCGAQILGSILDFNRHVYFHVFHVRLKQQGALQAQFQNLGVCHLGQQSQNWIPELPENLQCLWEDCKVIFDNPYHFFSHVGHHCEDHDPDKDPVAKCLWAGCKTTVRNRDKLRDHLRSHSGEKKVACPTCGGMFANPPKFADHILRQADTEVLRYECSHCNRRFSTERMLREHMRRHVNSYKCPMCEMTCPAPFALRNHIRYKHSDEKPFKCGHCEFSAKSSADLRKHLDSHNVEDQFSCHIDNCPFSARSYNSLALHFKKQHQSVDVNIPRYICHVCKRVFGRGFTLTHHLKEKHQFQWPPGHSRFRYKLHGDGFLRLQTVRYECAELEELPAQTSTNANPKPSGTAKLRRKRIVATNMAPGNPNSNENGENSTTAEEGTVRASSNEQSVLTPTDLSSIHVGETSGAQRSSVVNNSGNSVAEGTSGVDQSNGLSLPVARKYGRKKNSKARVTNEKDPNQEPTSSANDREESPSALIVDQSNPENLSGEEDNPCTRKHSRKRKATATKVSAPPGGKKRGRKPKNAAPTLDRVFSEELSVEGEKGAGRNNDAKGGKNKRGRKAAKKVAVQGEVKDNEHQDLSSSVLLSMPTISTFSPVASTSAAAAAVEAAVETTVAEATTHLIISTNATTQEQPGSVLASNPHQNHPHLVRSVSMELEECPPEMVQIHWSEGSQTGADNNSAVAGPFYGESASYENSAEANLHMLGDVALTSFLVQKQE